MWRKLAVTWNSWVCLWVLGIEESQIDLFLFRPQGLVIHSVWAFLRNALYPYIPRTNVEMFLVALARSKSATNCRCVHFTHTLSVPHHLLELPQISWRSFWAFGAVESRSVVRSGWWWGLPTQRWIWADLLPGQCRRRHPIDPGMWIIGPQQVWSQGRFKVWGLLNKWWQWPCWWLVGTGQVGSHWYLVSSQEAME